VLEELRREAPGRFRPSPRWEVCALDP
jgi:hypothetical protein